MMKWILTPTGYLNMGMVVRMEQASNGTVLHLLNGERVETFIDIDDLAEQTGTIVGWFLDEKKVTKVKTAAVAP